MSTAARSFLRRVPLRGRPWRYARLLICLLFGLHLGLCSVVLAWEGVAVRVLDGDTLEILNHKNRVVRIHLYGVESPLLTQPFGQEARNHFALLVMGKTLDVTNVGRDSLGRMRSLVAVEGQSINREMVRSGYARVSNAYGLSPSCRQWLEVENLAKLEGQGMWDGVAPSYEDGCMTQVAIDGPVLFEAN